MFLSSCLQSTSEPKEVRDPARDPQYAEPQLDAMRAQKDQVETPLSLATHPNTLLSHGNLVTHHLALL